MFRDVTLFARKYVTTFHWLSTIAYSFFNSDWLELVICFHPNEQDGEQNAFIVNFSVISDLRQGLKASLRNFWIETCQEQQ